MSFLPQESGFLLKKPKQKSKHKLLMGQKTNPNILRLGKVKEWKSKYIEKKPTESSITIFRDLEIQKFISQLFARYGLKIQNCKIYYSENCLHIYISYYNSTRPLLVNYKIKTKPKKKISELVKNKITNIKKATTIKQFYFIKAYKKTFNKSTKKKSFQDWYLLQKRTHRLNTIKNVQNYINEKNYKTSDKQSKNLFVSKILKSLNLFTNKKHDIFLNLKQLNKETALFQKISKINKHKIKKKFIKLRRFQQNEFFKQGFNLLHNFTISQQNPTLLADFIALFLKKLKRPNFFLRFLKSVLKTLLAEKFSQFERIQIKIKGRFNGAPRSTHRFINIGKNVPILTLNSKIDYGEATAYTSNGTFGVKVWIYKAI